ncbi:MAG TPA: dihydrodipicolinate synthase family protein [Humisphaera sp.]|jgi:N-acetylneuraminate lyase|nr:dihydrodipicolinate synthase family protein [Humisphaera sp.]
MLSDVRLQGLIAAPFTPFDADGDLKLSVIERQAEHLVSRGVGGAFVCGTTGEGPSMTTQERMDVSSRWTQVAREKLTIIVHVGHASQRDAMALAAHAASIGAHAVSAMAPFFFKPANVEQTVAFMLPIAAAAESLPFYYYHIPSMTGVNITIADLVDAALQQIPNFKGVKYTHGDLMDFARCQQKLAGRGEVAWGLDELLLSALVVGAQAAVGSTYNYASPLYLKMIEAFNAQDLTTARMCSQTAAEMVAVLLKYGVLRTGKAAMALAGVDCGPPRAPVSPLSTQERDEVAAAFERIGTVRSNSRQ